MPPVTTLSKPRKRCVNAYGLTWQRATSASSCWLTTSPSGRCVVAPARVCVCLCVCMCVCVSSYRNDNHDPCALDSVLALKQVQRGCTGLLRYSLCLIVQFRDRWLMALAISCWSTIPQSVTLLANQPLKLSVFIIIMIEVLYFSSTPQSVTCKRECNMYMYMQVQRCWWVGPYQSM